jgi:hypothetical protein
MEREGKKGENEGEERAKRRREQSLYSNPARQTTIVGV